jgi:hypothetical protein
MHTDVGLTHPEWSRLMPAVASAERIMNKPWGRGWPIAITQGRIGVHLCLSVVALAHQG